MRLVLNNLAATDRLGAHLAGLLAAGRIITLSGPLGVGKSELARAIIRHGCGETGDIPSPSFTLVQTYQTADGLPVWHMDCWRLADPAEAINLGIEDAFYEAACLIEWPEKLSQLLPSDRIGIVLGMAANDGGRLADIAGPTELLTGLQTAFAS